MLASHSLLSDNFDNAYIEFNTAREHYCNANDYSGIINTCINIAYLNSNVYSQFDLALEDYEFALYIAEQLDLPDNKVDILIAMISIYTKTHKMDKANELQLKLKELTINSPEMAIVGLKNHGSNSLDRNDIEIAISFYKEALSIANENNISPITYGIYTSLSLAYLSMGNMKEALDYSELDVKESKEVFSNDICQKYQPYRIRYKIQAEANDFNGCMASLDSLQISIKALGSDSALGSFMIDKGKSLAQFNKWEQAIECYSEADRLFKHYNNADSLFYLEFLIPAYAYALYSNNQHKEVKEQYERYASITEFVYGEKSMEHAYALFMLANIEGHLNELNNAANHYIKSWQLTRDIAMLDLRTLPSNAIKKYWNSTSELFFHMPAFGLKAQYNENEFTASAYEALMFSKGLLLSVNKTTEQSIKDSEDSDLISLLAERDNLKFELDNLKKDGQTIHIKECYARQDSLDRLLSFKLKQAGIFPSIPNTKVQEIAASLSIGEAIVDVTDFIDEDNKHFYVAFLMKHGMKAPRLFKVFEQAELDSLLQENNGKHSNLYNEFNSSRMHELVWKPIAKEIEGVKTLYFVPSGILYQIAVEAIMTPGRKTVGEKLDIIRLSSSNELLSIKSRKNMNNFATARLYGGLEYDMEPEDMLAKAKEYELPPIIAKRGGIELTRGDSTFNRLESSAREVMEISKILKSKKISVKTFMNNEGTEESFMSMSGQSPDLLLLSTHGFYYSPENVPSWSALNGYDNAMHLTGLVMSGGNAEWMKREIPHGVYGGLLMSSDIERLDLSNTQMAILSACDTGLGDLTNEGVYGLQRAFKKAGVQTLVMSLWSVSDLVTTKFMIAFHEELVGCNWNKRKAFLKAQKRIRKEYSDPYYWAGFIMVD